MTSTAGQRPPTGSAPSSAPYFPDAKKSEVNELRALLRNPAIERDIKKKRDVIKKVIAYMTLGIDVSRLFSEMIMASVTQDVVQKKLVYLYIVNYAESNKDISIMSINTLLKDSKDENPMIRGLALRSICSLRVANIVEYVTNPIQAGLKDISPYVRKTAVMGCVKLFFISPSTVRNSGIVDKLLDMLRDKDPQVVSNVLCALGEIMAEEGGIPVNKSIVHHLLNRIKEFSEWSQCFILDLVARYDPGNDEDEIFDIMNLLEERLKHSNSAVVLATTKIFLHLTQGLPDIHHQVYERIATPLLTMANGPNPELGFACLHHINLLVQRVPDVFEGEYKQFFCRFNDPSYIKLLKLDIITRIATERNALAIAEELAQYVNDSVDIARRSIRACSSIAIQVSSVSEAIVGVLLGLLDIKVDYVSAEVMRSVADILRKYPERAPDVLPLVATNLKTIDDPQARAAMIWTIGEFGEQLDEAPYLLEPIVEGFAEEIPLVRMHLLTAVMRLFFKRPPECQKMLGSVLSKATNDASHQDVHDRAMLYYRLLGHDVDEAARVVNSSKDPIYSFTEDADSDVKDRLFDEFNTLSVVFGQPAERFIVKTSLEEEIRKRAEVHAEELKAKGQQSVGESGVGIAEDEDDPDPSQTGLLVDADAPVAPGGAAAAAAGGLSFGVGTIEPAVFQQKWTTLGGETFKLPMAIPADQIEGRLSAHNVRCVASGSQGGMFKGYFYGVIAGAGQSVVLLEAIVQGPEASCTVKADNPAAVRPFITLLQRTISQR